MQKNTSFSKKNLVSISLTLAIVFLLILSGPVKALTFSLTAFTDNNVLKGAKTSAVATININSNERVSLNPVALFLNGVEECSFNAYNAQVVSGCSGILIEVLENNSATFGYGYGYAYGSPYGYGYNQGYTNGLFKYNITLDTSSFSAGDYTMQLFVNVSDYSVYSSDTQTLTVVEDITAPIINLVNPNNNYLINNSDVTTSFYVEDDFDDSIACDLYDNNNLKGSFNVLNGTTRFDTYTYTEGKHSWYVNCTDNFDNSAISELRNFSVDISIPTVNLTYPANNTFQNHTGFSMSFLPNDTYENDSKLSCSLYVDNNLWARFNNLFTPGDSVGLGTTFSEGTHTYYVTCWDDVNNTGTSETRRIIMDVTKPRISFVSPTLSSGSYINVSNIETNVSSSDVNVMNISTKLYDSNQAFVFASNWIEMVNNSFYYDFTSLADGLYYINSTSCDIVNNCNSTETRNITIDTVAPEISLSLLEQTQTSLFLKVNITDINPIVETCNVSRGIINGTNEIQNITETGLTCGTSYSYNVTCKDIAGNYNSTLASFSTASCPSEESSGGSASCLTEWQCSSWSECNGGTQTRSCEKARSYCYVREDKPIETQTCEIITETESENSKSSNPLTAAVIGAAGPIALGTLGFIVIVGLGFVILRFFKARRLARVASI